MGARERVGRTREKGKERLQARHCFLHFSRPYSERKNSDWSELIKCQSSTLLPRAWSRALIPFPFPFEPLPRRLRTGRLPVLAMKVDMKMVNKSFKRLGLGKSSCYTGRLEPPLSV